MYHKHCTSMFLFNPHKKCLAYPFWEWWDWVLCILNNLCKVKELISSTGEDLNQGYPIHNHTQTHLEWRLIKVYDIQISDFTDADPETQVKCLAKVTQVLSETLSWE